MSDGPYQATDTAELRRQIMSPTVPKNEREHWAARTIEALERELADRIDMDNARIAKLELGILEMVETAKAKDALIAQMRHAVEYYAQGGSFDGGSYARITLAVIDITKKATP